MSATKTLNWNIVIIAVLLLVVVGVGIWKNVATSGEIRGRVVDQSGAPVEGSSVRLREKTLNLIKEGVTTKTDATGQFLFTDQEMIEFFLDATGPGDLSSEERRYHLYFPGQDFAVPEPLVVAPRAASE